MVGSSADGSPRRQLHHEPAVVITHRGSTSFGQIRATGRTGSRRPASHTARFRRRRQVPESQPDCVRLGRQLVLVLCSEPVGANWAGGMGALPRRLRPGSPFPSLASGRRPAKIATRVPRPRCGFVIEAGPSCPLRTGAPLAWES
jgi:hypothetical protein